MNRSVLFGMLSIALLLLLASTAMAQRQDAIWARNVAGATITMDGALNEPAWAAAEEIQIVYGQSAGLPTSGWRPEFQPEVIFDGTNATVKFLVDGNYLWVGFDIPDSSVGGIADWARWDGLLMNLRDRASANRPTPAVEYFYTWWYVNIDSLIVPGAPPRFIGRYGNFDDTTRTPEQRAAWDARTVVDGISNDDATPDVRWTVEMRFDVSLLGYNPSDPNGDVIEFNFSIWDGDWVFSGVPGRIASMRTWWQNPWGNADANNAGRVYVHPNVTINSGALPDFEPDVVLPNAIQMPEPQIDGVLNDAVWSQTEVYSFDIKWDDATVRNSYPGIGPYRSGQFQPELGGNPRPPVLNGGDATIKMFFREHYLYFAADVRDLLVQGTNEYDRRDGVRIIVGDRGATNDDNIMFMRALTASLDGTCQPVALDYLITMLDSSSTQYALALKPNTTCNNNTDVDEGFIVEMKIDLTYLGYPSNLGDKLLFFGVMLMDGDSFEDPLSDYGTRTWFFREHDGGPAVPWAVMNPEMLVGIGDKPLATLPNTIELLGNFPNPFNPNTTIRYSIPFAGNVEMSFFNVLGQEIASVNATSQAAGTHDLSFDARNLSSGIYFYKIRVNSPATGKSLDSNVAKMVLIR
ncbi:MAG: T9SS type A sorting domain-containing protein [Calditrichaceae bacterium]|nr:T9SS type A sorting domain-containing protein [Calditrichia bacterium]NUQ40081.1 T9SS type A sorting domain-containing protein [Calditrichaceae bacterium]